LKRCRCVASAHEHAGELRDGEDKDEIEEEL
jgi:hypothetical protein